MKNSEKIRLNDICQKLETQTRRLKLLKTKCQDRTPGELEQAIKLLNMAQFLLYSDTL